MTGSNIVISSRVSINLAGLKIPLEIDVTLLDPAKMEIPTKKACGKGSKICDESDYGSGLDTFYGTACQAMCLVANTATSNKAALKSKTYVMETIQVSIGSS